MPEIKALLREKDVSEEFDLSFEAVVLVTGVVTLSVCSYSLWKESQVAPWRPTQRTVTIHLPLRGHLRQVYKHCMVVLTP